MKIECILTAILVATLTAQAQDKVILLNGDTLQVVVSANPKVDAGLGRNVTGHVNDYGFRQVVIIYPPDSVRIQLPGQIRGYMKAEKGKFLGSGYFESRVLDEKQLGWRYGQQREVFLQRVDYHKNYTIWFYREHTGETIPERYFFMEMPGAGKLEMFTTYKQWLKWAANHPPFDVISRELENSGGQYHRNRYLFDYLQKIMGRFKELYP